VFYSKKTALQFFVSHAACLFQGPDWRLPIRFMLHLDHTLVKSFH